MPREWKDLDALEKNKLVKCLKQRFLREKASFDEMGLLVMPCKHYNPESFWWTVIWLCAIGYQEITQLCTAAGLTRFLMVKKFTIPDDKAHFVKGG